jgi:cobalt-precorrin 5A hydrolase/precorrin-3B C17-methyltransferase
MGRALTDGILIRSVAPYLASKQEEPAVVAVAEDGSVAVPLTGGYRGGKHRFLAP